MTSDLRVGVADLTTGWWTAGGAYSETIARSLAAEALRRGAPPILHLSATRRLAVPGLVDVELPAYAPLPGEAAARRALRLPARARTYPGEGRLRRRLLIPDPTDAAWAARRHGVDVLFPDVYPPRRGDRLTHVAWIADFQHRTHPGLFPDHERARRDHEYAALARESALVVLSSAAMRDEMARFFPEHLDKARVVPFPSRLSLLEDLPADTDAPAAYRVRAPYVLCANQFWAHKNHGVVLRAAALLRDRRMPVTIVLTGLPLDYRDPANATISSVLQYVARHGLDEHIRVLGHVPYDDLVSLLRHASALVQPSTSEGWNTSVQDAKALGVPLVCSDLPVHREQAPGARFFAADDHEALADALTSAAAGGVHSEREHVALAAERRFAAEHGALLWSVLVEATS